LWNLIIPQQLHIVNNHNLCTPRRYLADHFSSSEPFYQYLVGEKLSYTFESGPRRSDAQFLRSRFTVNAVSSLKINYLEEKVVASPNKKW